MSPGPSCSLAQGIPESIDTLRTYNQKASQLSHHPSHWTPNPLQIVLGWYLSSKPGKSPTPVCLPVLLAQLPNVRQRMANLEGLLEK